MIGTPGPLVFNIVVNYCCKRKMLKRNWNWRNNRLFLTRFCHWWSFNWGYPGPLPPLGYANAPSEENKKGVRKLSARFLAFSQIIPNGSKNSAVLEPRTGQFSRTWGFEAKAKDSKICPPKVFKMCPSKDSTSGYQYLNCKIFHGMDAFTALTNFPQV